MYQIHKLYLQIKLSQNMIAESIEVYDAQDQYQGCLFEQIPNKQLNNISKIQPSSRCQLKFQYCHNTKIMLKSVLLQIRGDFLIQINRLLKVISVKKFSPADRFQVFRGSQAGKWKLSGINFIFEKINFKFFIDENQKSMDQLKKFVDYVLAKPIIEIEWKKYFICYQYKIKTRCCIIYFCQRKYDGKKVVFKVYRKNNYLIDPKNRALVDKQIQIMALMNHQNVIKQLGVCESQNKLYIVLEYYSFNLKQIIMRNQIKDQSSIIKILQKLVKAVAYIHSKGIMHRDLKPENIVMNVQNTLEPVIIDFGMAIQINSKPDKGCGTAGFFAPEIFKSQPYNQKCDIFSLGAIFYYLLTKKPLFEGNDQESILHMNKLCEINIPLANITNDHAKDIVRKMLDENPQNRPSANQILNHLFFKVEQKKRKRNNIIQS